MVQFPTGDDHSAVRSDVEPGHGNGGRAAERDAVHLGGNFLGGADRKFDQMDAGIGSEALLAIIAEITARVLSLGFTGAEDASTCVGAIIGQSVIPAASNSWTPSLSMPFPRCWARLILRGDSPLQIG